MTRIEKNETLPAEAGPAPAPIEAVKMRGRGARFFLGCCLPVLAGLLLTASGLAWLTAKTGLVEVPIFTAAFYRVPTPEHEVKAGVALDTLLNNELTNEINRRLREGGGTLKDRALTLKLPEESFTTLLRNLIETAGTRQIDAAHSQVNITKERGLTLFLPLTDNAQKTALIVGLLAGTENGALTLTLNDLRIGSLALPAWLYRPLVDPIIRQNLDQLNAAFGKYAKFQKIEYEDGAAWVTGEIAVEILEAK